jgi:ParB family transcriptional regulator, chromosome partitioning protein
MISINKINPMNTISNNNPLDPKPKSIYLNNSIFWIDVEKIVPNPYQPRREFDPHALKDLSESIRMYGLLQPLTVTRREITKEDGGLAVEYELISGERRLRASKLAGISQVPAIIRSGESVDDARVKLELAIIENLQREDLNAVDRAKSFQRLADEFGLKHTQIAEKVGKSREYVTNSIRLLMLPEHILQALSEKRITEGHTRPLLMLVDKPEEQEVLFKEIIYKKLTVREAEQISRKVAVERARKKDPAGNDPETREYEEKLNKALGTRVMIEKKEKGGKIVIDYFSNDDLRHLIDVLEKSDNQNGTSLAEKISASVNGTLASVDTANGSAIPTGAPDPRSVSVQEAVEQLMNGRGGEVSGAVVEQSSTVEGVEGSEAEVGVETAQVPEDDSTPADRDEDELYSVRNFSI